MTIPEKKSFDKRAAKRVPFRVPVKYGVNGNCKLTALGIDISSTGICIKTNNVYNPGTVINMEIIQNHQTFYATGTVMWAKKVPPNLIYVAKAGMGIHFKDVDMSLRNLIQEKAERGNG